MTTVGLTGGYATGKSFVAREFERLGCHLIYADKLGHEVLLPSGEAYVPVVDTFGREILIDDGTIDRKRLAALVFHSNELLGRLTAIVHPAVFRLEQQRIDEYAIADRNGITVIEAAILIETGRFRSFDRLVVTHCQRETQIARAMERDATTREEILARLEQQLPSEEKLEYADYVVQTDGTKEETVAQVDSIFFDLRQVARNEKQ